MSALIIDYSELQTIATNATSLASKAENYCNELNSNVYSAFGSVTAGVNDVLSSAMYYVAAKQKSLTEKAEEYARFAGNVCTLIEHAKQADQDVATKIENNQEDFLKKHSEIQAAEGIEAFLLNLFVEVKNACPLFEIVADCYIAVFDTLDSAFDALKYFYECGGGKELLNIVIAVAVAVVAVATFIACFPLSLAFSWAGLVALATVIGSGIAAVNAITDVLTSTRALESRLNGDPAWASIYGKQDKFSDVLRDTNFGSGTLNKLSYGAATTIDTVEAVCDVIVVTDMAHKFTVKHSDNLGITNAKKNVTSSTGGASKGTGGVGTSTKKTTLEQNRIRGREFEKKKFAEFSSKYDNAVEQVTIKTKSGVKTRVDAIGLDKKGRVVIQEFKSSQTAPLTKNQKIAFPEIFESGGTVVGKGKGVFTGGYNIPKGTRVRIIRP